LPPGLALLFLSLALQGIHAQGRTEDSGWSFGLTPFYMIGPEELQALASPGLTIEKTIGIVAGSSEGPLSISLASILASAMEPSPERYPLGDLSTQDSPMPVSFSWKDGDKRFADLLKAKETLEGLDGLAAGFYSLRGENLECRIVLLEKGAAIPRGVIAYRGGIASLEDMAGELLPDILAWVANRPLEIIDLRTIPASGSVLSLEGKAPSGMIQLSGSRVFIFGKGDFSIAVNRKGFKPGVFRVSEVKPGTYSAASVELVRAETAPEPETSIAGAAGILEWKEELAFRSAGKKYQSALGRFIVSLPFSLIAAGTFYSFWEAYSRSAAAEGALYGSGAAAAVAIALSAGFIIETGFRLAEVLRVSR